MKSFAEECNSKTSLIDFRTPLVTSRSYSKIQYEWSHTCIDDSCRIDLITPPSRLGVRFWVRVEFWKGKGERGQNEKETQEVGNTFDFTIELALMWPISNPHFCSLAYLESCVQCPSLTYGLFMAHGPARNEPLSYGLSL